MKYIGVDIGSTYTKYSVLNITGQIENLFCEVTPIRQLNFFEDKMAAFKQLYPHNKVISCGYGRENIEREKAVSELTALAVGVHYCAPQYQTILDIGGQDTKIIVQNDGKIKQFFLNDKCAAGCGMFLQNVLNLLHCSFEELDVTGISAPDYPLSSVCAVFAQTEIVEMIAKGISEEEIIRSVLWHILLQARHLTGKTTSDQILLSGGLSRIKGIEGMARNAFQKDVAIDPNSSYFSAIGCAVTAMNS